ncbi:hypothetical protein SELMODRAFT_417590 [Selaginella moellendorffii]|uniref:Ricin B lectin domain-containing protein n=1 Tax=Selaginella moellendorffii TaxID=88036 RepID=D8S2Y4_SELML|nr:hypothetical protein SELMODRAFT_417590 [Selaginella moellendorffii]
MLEYKSREKVETQHQLLSEFNTTTVESLDRVVVDGVRLVRIVSSTNPSKVISVNHGTGTVVLADLNHNDNYQVWELSYAMGRLRDSSGLFAYSLKNFETQTYLHHGMSPGEVIITQYFEIPDSDLLWNSGTEDVRGGYYVIRATTNVYLSLSIKKPNSITVEVGQKS